MNQEKDGSRNQQKASKSGGEKPGTPPVGAGGSDYPNRPAPPPPGAPGPAPVEGDNEETLDEPPIIIQGGGSVLLNIPTKFKEKGTNKGGGKYKNEVQDLISIQIDNNEPILLDVDATIVITCGARAKK